jgi:signal peptidase
MDSTKLARIDDLIDTLQPVARRFGAILLLFCLLLGYLLEKFIFSGRLPDNLNLYLLQPLLWLTIALLALCLWSVSGERFNPFEQRSLILSAAMMGGIQVAVLVLFGLLSGFGKSPYARSFIMILLNLWFVVTRLVGMEVARWYLGKALGRVNPGMGYIAAWLVPFFLLFPVGKFSLFGQPESAIRMAGGTLLPAAAESLLAAYLAITGGPLASMAYRGVIQTFEWLSPILPDLPWLGAAFVGVVVPVLGLLALSRPESVPLGEDDTKPVNVGKAHEQASPASWLLVAALAVGFIWLNSGFLGVRPSLISGNSMNPALYPGDVIITSAIQPEKIEVGDIIRFNRDGIDVVHRVVEVQSSASGPVFTTRGDSNNVNDVPVSADRYQGKLILTLPKIGWIAILFRMVLARLGGAL